MTKNCIFCASLYRVMQLSPVQKKRYLTTTSKHRLRHSLCTSCRMTEKWQIQKGAWGGRSPIGLRICFSESLFPV